MAVSAGLHRGEGDACDNEEMTTSASTAPQNSNVEIRK